MIRPAVAADTPAIVAVCEATGLFPPEGLAAIARLLDDHHASGGADGHRALVRDEGTSPSGVAYLVPKEMTDRTWELLMLMVDPAAQGRGIGTGLLGAAENAARAACGRLILIETAATPDFERTRGFYRRNGYVEVAVVPDYYADGVGKATYTKAL